MGCFLGTMVCPSANSMHELSANVEVRDENLASFEKGVDQANAGDGYVDPSASKAETILTSRGCPLLRRFRLQLRLCLCRDVFALMSCSWMRLLVLPRPRRPLLAVDPALLGRWVAFYRGLTLPLGSGSGLVSWDEFVPGLWSTCSRRMRRERFQR